MNLSTFRLAATKSIASKCSAMLVTLVLMLVGISSFGQTATDGDYRTRSTGALTWTGTTTWQVRAASTWANTTTPPTSTANVYIQAGSTVTVNTATATC